MKAFTGEWLDTLAKALRDDAMYQERTRGFDRAFQFVVQPQPQKGITEQHAFGLNLPQCDKTWMGLQPDSPYIMSGSYQAFFDVMTKRVGAVPSMLMLKLRVKGNIVRLLAYTSGINRFVEVLTTLPTEFEGKFWRA